VTPFLAYPAFALFMLVLVATGVFPRTRWNGTQSGNRLASVEMHGPEYYTATNQSMRGVHAQERVECFLKWVMLLSIVGIIPMKTRWFFRQSELIGHAAEIVVAGKHGFALDTYLHDEAARTYGNREDYAAVIGDDTLDEFKRALRKRFFIARVLVAVNAVAIGRTP
jgi:hypothetical protein